MGNHPLNPLNTTSSQNLQLSPCLETSILGPGWWVCRRDDRDAGNAPLGDGLLVGPSVGHDQDAGLEESSLDLISACGERTSDGAAAGIPGEKHIC